MLFAVLLALAAPSFEGPARGAEVPPAEAEARAACRAEAETLGVKVPPGACDTPAQRLRFLTAAREACTRSRNVSSGTLHCRRDQVAD